MALGVRGRVLAWLGGELAVWSILLVSIVGLSRVWPLYALNRKGLGPGAWVGLLGHPLPVCAKGADAGWSGLVHAHGRAAHARGCHASCHAGRVQAAPMEAGPRGPGWFMNWLLYAWVGPIGPYWFISLFCVSCKAATVAVAVAVAVAAAAATAAAAAAAAGWVKSAGGRVCGGMPMPAGALGPPG